jgi:hypothetical protein
MSKRSTIFICGLVAMMILLGGTAQAQNAITDHANLISIGGNNPSCLGPTTNTSIPNNGVKGVVNVQYNKQQNRFSVNVAVHDALPNTAYVVDIRCWLFGGQGAIGVLTTNGQGTGTFQKDLWIATDPNMAAFYVDISVLNAATVVGYTGPIGAGGYGDTFIAGPLNVLTK